MKLTSKCLLMLLMQYIVVCARFSYYMQKIACLQFERVMFKFLFLKSKVYHILIDSRSLPLKNAMILQSTNYGCAIFVQF